MKQQVKRLTAILVLAAVYFLFGRLGLSLAFLNANASAVWPPTGISLAAMLFFGTRLWPGVFIGAFFVNLYTESLFATSATGSVLQIVLTSLGISLGNTLEAVCGAWFVNRSAGGREVFTRAQNIFNYAILAAIVSTAISATVGVTSLCLGGFADWQSFRSIWLTWWLGDAVSDLTLAPLLLVFRFKRISSFNWRRFLEGILLLALIVVVGLVVFGGWFPSKIKTYPLEYLTIPFLFWASIRFRQAGAVLGACVISAIALYGTLHGYGPFVLPYENDSLLLLQAFIGTTSLTTLVLAAAVMEREEAEGRLFLQFSLSRILAESNSLAEAAPKIIRAVCDQGGWDVGAIWRVEPADGRLRCLETLHQRQLAVPEFEKATRSLRLDRGIGLPGRVWERGQATWIEDVIEDSNFPRAKIAQRENLHAAFAFPIFFGGEFLGVIEFFSRDRRRPDGPLLEMTGAIGRQLGEFIERKRIEEALRSSERNLRLIAENTRDVIFAFDMNHRIIYANAAVTELTGYTLEDIRARKFVNWIHPDDQPRMLQHWDDLFRGRGYVDEQFRLITKDGKIKWCSSTWGPLYDESGQQVGVQGRERDITANKEAEEALAEVQQRYRQIVDTTSEGIWLVDANFQTTFVNRWMAEMLGYTTDEMIGRIVSEFVFEEDRASLEMRSEQRRQGRFGRYDFRYRRKNGAELWVFACTSPVLDEKGNFIGALGMFTDITERRRTDEQLKEESAFRRAILNSALDGLVAMNHEGCIIEFNPAAEKIFGHKRDQVIGKRLADVIIPPSLRAQHERGLKRYLAGGASAVLGKRLEMTALRADGSEFPAELAITKINLDGPPVFTGYIRDITERKRSELALLKAQEQLTQHAENLERRVAERTAKLRETIQSLESFTYSIAHDLRSPLRAMNGLTTILLEDYAAGFDDTGKNYAHRIVESAGRMDRLIEDLLSYARLSQLDAPLGPVNLQGEIEAVLALLREEIRLKSAKIQIESPMPTVPANATILQQIFGNLISNAIKFVPAGNTPALHIWCEEHEKSVRVWFADNGIGVDAKHHERIFKVFERLHVGPAYPGTGIGLAIVRKGAERMGAQVGLESELGKGSRFWIELNKS